MKDEDNGDGTEVKQMRVLSPVAKTANVKRVLQRLLMAAKEETGPTRIVGIFAVTVSEGKEAGLAYALTWDEGPLLARAVPAGLEKALGVLRAAATKPARKA